jgi:putative transcriptional regulator
MLRLKIDVLPLLKEAGYSSYRLRKENILAQSTIQKFRERKMVSTETLEWLCEVLNYQPGEIIEYVKDGEQA